MGEPRAARWNLSRTFKALALVLAVVILLPILSLALIIFSGETLHRTALERFLESALDRPVEIAGSVILSFSLSPKLSISDLKVGEALEWQSGEEAQASFLRLGKGEFQIDLRHLIAGEFVIPRLALSDAEVNLRRNEEGGLNWIATEKDQAWEVDGEEETLIIPLVVELSLEHVRVLYTDEMEDRQADLVLTSLTKTKNPDTAQSLLSGKGVINEQPFELKGHLASLDALLGSRESFPLEIDAAFPSMDIQLSGMANPWGDDRKNDLALAISIYTITGLAKNLAMPLEFEGALQATGRITGALGRPRFSDIDVALSLEDGGGFNLEGKIADLVNLQGLDLQLSASFPENFVARDHIPLNLPELAAGKIAGQITGNFPRIGVKNLDLDISGETGERLTLQGDLLADLSRAKPELAQGNFALTLQLKDSKSLASLIATELPSSGVAHLEADVEFAADLLKIKELMVQAEKLGGITLRGAGEIDEVDFYDENLLLHLKPNLNLNLDIGDGAQFFEALGWGTPKLGAFSASLGLTRAKEGYKLQVLSAKLDGEGDLSAEVSGEIRALSFTPEFRIDDLDLMLSAYSPSSVPISRWAGLDFPELGATRIKAKVVGPGRVPQFREIEISVGEGGPIPLTATGNAAHIDYLAEPPRLTGIDLALSVKGSDPEPIFQHYGIELPYFGVFEGTARLVDRNESLSLSDLDLNAKTISGQNLKITGEVDDLIAVAGVRLAADYRGALAQVIGLEPADALGEISASAKLSDKDGSIGLEGIKVKSSRDGLYEIELSGDLDDLLERDEIVLTVNAAVFDAQQLAGIFGADFPPFARFSFEGDVSGGAEDLRGEGNFALGTSRLMGTVTGGWTGPRPHFTGRLTSPLLSLEDFGLLSEDGDEEEPETASQSPQRIFQSDILPFEVLRDFDLDFEIDIDELIAGIVDVDRVTAKVSLSEGMLTLDPLNFHFAGGTIANTLRLDGAANPARIALTSNVGDLDLGTVFGELGTEVPLDGELDLRVELTAVGQSPKELAESLTGKVGLAMSRGRILLGSFNLTTVDVFSWLFSSEAQQGYSEITCFILRFNVKEGIAKSEAVVLDTPSVRSGGLGEIDLHSETLNILFDPEPKQRRLVQFTTPFAIRGPINAPSVVVNPASATANALGGIIFSPLNALGSLFTAVSDNGGDADNPCLTQ